jgi:hypothetical protein
VRAQSLHTAAHGCADGETNFQGRMKAKIRSTMSRCDAAAVPAGPARRRRLHGAMRRRFMTSVAGLLDQADALR